jgi:hypothetical protein
MIRAWLRKQLAVAAVDEAYGAPLRWYQRLFRWIGWP